MVGQKTTVAGIRVYSVDMVLDAIRGGLRFEDLDKKPGKPARVGQEIDDKILRCLELHDGKQRISRPAMVKWVRRKMKKNPPSEDYIRKRLSLLSETGILVSEESVYGGKKKTYYRLAAGDKK